MGWHLVDNVIVRTGSAYHHHVVPVEVSLNGKAFTADAVGFSYYAEPTVSYVRFDRGPSGGRDERSDRRQQLPWWDGVPVPFRR